MANPSSSPPGSSLRQRYRAVRRQTAALTAPLAPEDMVAQSMPDASPVKWHLAHTTWFFETFVLERLSGHRPFHDGYKHLFNSYYNTVGEPYPRPQRGLVSRPTVAEVVAYREHVDARMQELLDAPGAIGDELGGIVEVGLQHEQQHQELLLTDLKHLLSFNPLHPVYAPRPDRASTKPPPLGFRSYAEGMYEVGYSGGGFAFDNERPRHRVFVDAFELGTRPVTAGEYLRFMEADGYARPELWLSDGWATVTERAWQAPLYWRLRNGQWWHMTLSGLQPVDPAEPVAHVSYYEADAYARWAGARLPSEQEWEVAVVSDGAAPNPDDGNFADDGLYHPQPPVATEQPDDGRLRQAFGDVWEWTRSPYVAYPGYVTPAGAIGEYNGKFMCNQWVLRGGSCATARGHVRPTYRNFFYPDARWQFSGLRLARDAGRR